ncbi:MAG: hypothetical protein HWE35_14955 [Rhodobacteraceae bacterium]|nr:hypothetical protein [Paracoccaceae bacterium]
MAEKSRDPFWRLNNPIMWGVLATATVIVFGIWAANQSVCQTDFWGNQSCGGSKWRAFLAAAPNEVGDTLAGFAGALAFVWLIATVWLQGQELAEQREELREQRVATQDMAKAMGKQALLADQQFRAFEEQRSSSVIDGLLPDIKRTLLSPSWQGLEWHARLDQYEGSKHVYVEFDYSAFESEQTPEEMMSLLYGTLAELYQKLTGYVVDSGKLPRRRKEIERFFRALRSMSEQIEMLPTDKKHLCSSWRLAEIDQMIREIQSDKYWNKGGWVA